MARPEEQRSREAAMLSDARAEVSLGREWAGPWYVGEGAMGTVQVWVKQDEKGFIRDRVAIKDVLSESATWRVKDLWFPPVKDFTAGSLSASKPVEVEAPLRLQALPNSQGEIGGCVRLRNSRVDCTNRQLRLYQEYCPYGDLFAGLKVLLPDPGERYWVPEAFLWHLFETVARLCILCERGDADGMGRQPWDSIIYRDWKLENVFLGSHQHDRYRGYPGPKVGDWGLATIVAHNDRRKSTDFGPCGNPCFRAPELVVGTDLCPSVPTSKTDVFGAGYLLYSLMERENGDIRLAWDARNIDPKIRVPANGRRNESKTSAAVAEHYSEPLVRLVNTCLRYDPARRPNWQDIQRHIAQNQDQRTRAANAADNVFDDLLFGRKGKYRLSKQLKVETTPPKGQSKMPSPPLGDFDDFGEPGGVAGTERGLDLPRPQGKNHGGGGKSRDRLPGEKSRVLGSMMQAAAGARESTAIDLTLNDDSDDGHDQPPPSRPRNKLNIIPPPVPGGEQQPSQSRKRKLEESFGKGHLEDDEVIVVSSRRPFTKGQIQTQPTRGIKAARTDQDIDMAAFMD